MSLSPLDQARMFPSVSLNQADFDGPRVATPSTVLSPGMSYSSNVTPLPRSSSITASMSSTWKPAAVALLVPANSLG